VTSPSSGASGCGLVIAVVILFALAVSAVVSVAALVDPFSWVPPLGEIFADCSGDQVTANDGCDFGEHYPGFWLHVTINFAYALVAFGLIVAFAFALRDFREAQRRRFEGDEAVERYRLARTALALVAGLLGGLAALPIIFALV
jgi:hypothetical protein